MSDTVTPPERQHDEIHDDAVGAMDLPHQRAGGEPPPDPGSRWRFSSAIQAARALKR